jgi:multiple sugar transport system ATP-binding protein
MNLLPATVVRDDGTLRMMLGGKEIAIARAPSGLPAGAKMTLGIRPEHMTVATGEAAMMDLTVDLVEQLGGETLPLRDGTGPPRNYAAPGRPGARAGWGARRRKRFA